MEELRPACALWPAAAFFRGPAAFHPALGLFWQVADVSFTFVKHQTEPNPDPSLLRGVAGADLASVGGDVFRSGAPHGPRRDRVPSSASC